MSHIYEIDEFDEFLADMLELCPALGEWLIMIENT